MQARLVNNVSSLNKDLIRLLAVTDQFSQIITATGYDLLSVCLYI